jgi:hypothetical protein
MARSMHRLLVTATALGALALADVAAAAVVQTDFSCYLQRKTVRLTGTGFTPGAPYQAALDGTPLGSGVVNSDGTISGTFASRRLPAGAHERRYRLTISDGTATANTLFRVTRFTADFRPSTGDPRTLRVRFQLYGFGPNRAIYLHYIRPGSPRNARARDVHKTIRLGRARGVCGKIPRTELRRLFPFAARHGDWRLQFDTRRTFRATARPRIVQRVRVRSLS